MVQRIFQFLRKLSFLTTQVKKMQNHWIIPTRKRVFSKKLINEPTRRREFVQEGGQNLTKQ